jgi:transcriptional regulator with XRE-family HTH domain
MDGKLAGLLAGQDQDELARAVAVHPETARYWLNGERLPWKSLLPAIAVATNIPLEDLRRAHREDRNARKAPHDAPASISEATRGEIRAAFLRLGVIDIEKQHAHAERLGFDLLPSEGFITTLPSFLNLSEAAARDLLARLGSA